MLWVSSVTSVQVRRAGFNEGGTMDLLSREERRSFHARFAQMPNPVHLLVFTHRESCRGATAPGWPSAPCPMRWRWPVPVAAA